MAFQHDEPNLLFAKNVFKLKLKLKSQTQNSQTAQKTCQFLLHFFNINSASEKSETKVKRLKNK